MRRPIRDAALVSAAGFFFALSAWAGPVDVSNRTLRAAAGADFFTGDQSIDGDSSSDVSDAVKHQVHAQAEAHAPLDETTSVSTSCVSDANFLALPDGFELTGSAASNLPANNPVQGLTAAFNESFVDFIVIEGATARFQYDIDIDAMVRSNQKVTLSLNRTGGEAVFGEIFKDSADGTLDLGPGTYQLQANNGSLSTTKGVPGETGSAEFRVSVTATSDAPPAIPLPTAVWPGAAMLGALWLGRHVRLSFLK